MNGITGAGAALIGSLGFAMMFGTRRRYLPESALGGLYTWWIYVTLESYLEMEFMACLIASAFAILYSEMLARMLRTPATLFVMPSIVPLVPGSNLYYAMSEAVAGNMSGSGEYGQKALLLSLAIALGISLVSMIRELRSPR